MLPVEHLKKVVDWCRERGALLVSDECYLECAWEAEPVSVLHPDVCGGSHEGILAVHSLSKRSNLAGYRCAFVAGDPAVVGELLAVRKNLGLMMPGPAAGGDGRRPRRRRARASSSTPGTPPGGPSCARRSSAAGFRIDHSEASLYLWATRGEDCWETVSWLADRGILVAPGAFYGVGRPGARPGRVHRHRRAGRRGRRPPRLGRRLLRDDGSAKQRVPGPLCCS